jgi:hypothetical protein
MLVALEKNGIPPEFPDGIPVPPCGTVTAALSVSTFALAFGNVNTFTEMDGPDTEKKALLDPPLLDCNIPVTAVA